MKVAGLQREQRPQNGRQIESLWRVRKTASAGGTGGAIQGYVGYTAERVRGEKARRGGRVDRRQRTKNKGTGCKHVHNKEQRNPIVL